MSAAAVEHPFADEPPENLLETANRLMEKLPGHRVEIIGGVITVAPPPDFKHACALTDLMIPFYAAGLHGGETMIAQGVGVWLPGGPQDYAIPDFVLVDADIEDHLISNNCYDPACFRLVLEVTSSNFNNDLRNKVRAYAEAAIPVYVIVDRKSNRLHVLTDPADGDYASHSLYAPGQQVTLPDSIGAKVTLDAAAVLLAGSGRGDTPDETG
ncbi:MULTISPECIES: Uma2 family endonuclease [unclassified Streptomyces]|uniref:Uma2 family endonuclease n=1 Tax=unclassified Streptomyces TaxID=2593676 RepID=UPI001BE7B4B1|nr:MULTISPECIES: Uma2 family endonuclease [unclassified Streptomyces]MBT2405709.1 Uma2 family endonuclease [Streptomyces sp. ISL-21]MBT2607001.1 Uma2 family endonuclease [Streptomyces sp. ISL-87]